MQNLRSAQSGRPSEYFGELTFHQPAMRQYLPEETFINLQDAIHRGERIDRRVADQVAAGMKVWAISRGATHYTHWFHPLTGATAEKHDAFINPVEPGRAIESFGGKELIQQEPDASSFPSGGIRNTFEARGYTAWDPTSPAFLMDNTLCIPTIFVSYNGEALDTKTPLLRTLHFLDEVSTAICRLFDNNTDKVVATLGWEQEYFLVDTALYHARPDLVLTGRTLFGHSSAKDQQLADHYFGVIPERVTRFMSHLEFEAHRLGIPVKTRHNEVAPNQFECAPVFEEVNLSVDHNQLMMHLMEKIAPHHGLTVLLHEKPFAGVNGSGKHNNWSLMTNTGENLLSPGKTPGSNLRFLTFLVNILKALDDHAGLLRASIASAGNDLRLGAHEAPPAIISAFIGSQLSETLDKIEASSENTLVKHTKTKEKLLFNLPKIPEILQDNTDRNRTSPFAFTGNKFEFRAVGSSLNCAMPMTALNLMLADRLKKFKAEVDTLTNRGNSTEDAVLQIVKKYITASKKIRFEGNSYGEAWTEEAASRGLPNINNTPEAVSVFSRPEVISLFADNHILTERELRARQEIHYEQYTLRLQIEARVVGDLATNHIIPVAIQYQNRLIENVKGLKEVLDAKSYSRLSNHQIQSIKDISNHIMEIKTHVDEMIQERKTANRIDDPADKAFAYRDKVLPHFEIIRKRVDKLELLIDDELWPLPKYREMLFS
ncbi:MAG: glutamine synthetase III [Bacteroidetes bacterium]|nr:glutamine synthetase III [Bacteroidota bacterium]